MTSEELQYKGKSDLGHAAVTVWCLHGTVLQHRLRQVARLCALIIGAWAMCALKGCSDWLQRIQLAATEVQVQVKVRVKSDRKNGRPGSN